jgi:hypothetical protein
MKYLWLVLGLMMAACSKSNDDVSTCMILTERQCASDPYQAYSTPDDADKKNAIKKYLEVNDILNINISLNVPFTGAVCLACSCPSGVSYTLELAASDTIKLKTLGLLVTGGPCN